MKILSIDSGLQRTGYAIIKKSDNKVMFISSGLITTDKSKSLMSRIQSVYSTIEILIKKFKPSIVVLEQLFFLKNKKTAFAVSQVQGAVILLCVQNKLKLTFLTPLQVKKTITGYGFADKQAVKKMIHLTLSETKKISQDDVIDAIAIGVAYCYLEKNLIR